MAITFSEITPAGHPLMAHHHNGIRSHLKSFDKIFQDDFKRKTDALSFVIIYIYLLFQSHQCF